MAECINCEEEYSNKRAELGYSTCLECGEADARAIAQIDEYRRARIHAHLLPAPDIGLTAGAISVVFLEFRNACVNSGAPTPSMA